MEERKQVEAVLGEEGQEEDEKGEAENMDKRRRK